MNYENIPDHEYYRLKTRHFDRHMLLLYFPSVREKNILEIGCGYGYFSDYIYRTMKPSHYHAYDKDRKAISYAQKQYKNITFFDGDISDSTMRREENWEYDCVFCMYVIEAITTKEILLAFFQKSYDALAEWWVFRLLTNNPAVFWSSRSKYFSHDVHDILSNGDMFSTHLYFTENDAVTVTDTYRSSDYILSLMNDVWFVDIAFKQPLVKKGAYPDMMDEENVSPVRIISAKRGQN